MEKGGVKTLVIILSLLIIVAGCVLAYKIMQNKELANTEEVVVAEGRTEEKVQKQVQIFNRK